MANLGFSTSTSLVHGLSTISGKPLCEPVQSTSCHAARANNRAMAPTMLTGRKFLVGGNWKANSTKKSIADLLNTLNAGPAIDKDQVEVVIAPPFPYLEQTGAALPADFDLAAQNCWIGPPGAYTGEVTAEMVVDSSAQWVILGHSERRHHPVIKETDDVVAQKAAYAISKGLKVIYCIGELLEEREADHTMDVCVRQLAPLAKALGDDDWDKVVIAYEPVWAIGTGKVANPDQAEEVHCTLRKWISENVNRNLSDSIRILYGGSVSASNCKDLAKLPDIDGFLVGGCSLKPEFLDIIQSYKIEKVAA